MRYPYERFLRFLVSRKVDVNRTLERYGLPRAGDIWIAECRSNLRATAPYPIVRFLDSDDQSLTLLVGVPEWAEKERFAPLWAMQPEFGKVPPPKAFDLAFKIFVNPHARAVMGMLLLTRASDEEITAIMREQFDDTIPGDALRTYRELFWDVALVGRKSWEPFIANLTTIEERNYIAFGVSSPAIADVRDMLGLEASVDHKTILNQIITRSYLQYKKAMEEPQPEAAGAMRWAELAIKAIGTSKTAGGFGSEAPVGFTAERFKKLFSVESTKSNHPTLADLTGEVADHTEPGKTKAQ